MPSSDLVGARPRRFVRRFREPGDLSSLVRAKHALRENRAPGETGLGRGWRKTGWSGPGPRGAFQVETQSEIQAAMRSKKQARFSGIRELEAVLTSEGQGLDGRLGLGQLWVGGGHLETCPQPPPRGSPSRRPSASNTEL